MASKGDASGRIVVLDTNVLLSDPDVFSQFPGSRIVIPETVLGELDKIKTSRSDPDLRFRGRQISRTIFELSEAGSLTEGVPLPDGGSLRVAAFNPDAELPAGLIGRNADDRILAEAVALAENGDDVTLVTNDLNMLLKAQTFDVAVARYDSGPESSFTRRYVVMPFQRYKIPLGILSLSLAVFAAIVVLTFASQDPSSPRVSTVPTEFREVLSDQQAEILELLLRLEDNPTDVAAQLNLANEYFNLREHTGNPRYAELSRRYYELYLQSRSDDNDARTDLATTYYLLGETDRAITAVVQVLDTEPDHVKANYNLGVFYWRGRGDLASAASQFRLVIDLAAGSSDPEAVQAGQFAKESLASIEEEAQEKGITLPETPQT